MHRSVHSCHYISFSLCNLFKMFVILSTFIITKCIIFDLLSKLSSFEDLFWRSLISKINCEKVYCDFYTTFIFT